MGVILPVNTTETWAEHFSTRGWSSIQDQIDAGYPVICQPVPTSAQYSEVFDFGSTIPTARASVELTTSIVAGSPTIVASIDTSSDGTTWTEYDGETSVFVSGVRYVRARVDATSDGHGVARIDSLSAKMDAKQKGDAGSINAVSTDAGGTRVDFNVPFVSVTSITPTPSGTTAAYATANYDSGDPTGFRVLLFNSSGTRISGAVYWSAKGY